MALSLEKLSINLEKSLLEAYRKLILNPSRQCCVQHPQYSFYYSEFCRKSNRHYDKRSLESKDEKQFDEILKNCLQKSEAVYLTARVSSLIQESMRRDDADVGKIIGAFAIMELYARNLISMPWKKEFHVILTYSGMYKVWIEPHLLGTDLLFHQFGYRGSSEGDKYVLAEQLPRADLEKAAMTFRLASAMCLVVFSAWKSLPDVSLGRFLEVAQNAPMSEEGLISGARETLKHAAHSRRKGSADPKPPNPLTGLDQGPGQVEAPEVTKRDKGTQYELTTEEGTEAVEIENPNVSIRGRSSLELKNFIEPVRAKSTKVSRRKGLKFNLGDMPMDHDQHHYGFSQPSGKGLSLRLTPEFPTVDDDYGLYFGTEHEQSSLFAMTMGRMKRDEENVRKLTFSTFKKEPRLDEREGMPSVHGLYPNRWEDDDEYDAGFEGISTQSKSESSLARFMKGQRSSGASPKRNS